MSKKLSLHAFQDQSFGSGSELPTSSLPTSSAEVGHRPQRGYEGKSSYSDRLSRLYGTVSGDNELPTSNRGAFSRDNFGRSDRPPRDDRGFSRDNFGGARSDRPPREERTFSRDDFGSGARSDRPPRDDRGFSRDNFGARSERGFDQDRVARDDKPFTRDIFGSKAGEVVPRERPSREDRPPREDRGFSRDNFGARSERGFDQDRVARDDKPFTRDIFGSKVGEVVPRERAPREDRPPRSERGFDQDRVARDDKPFTRDIFGSKAGEVVPREPRSKTGGDKAGKPAVAKKAEQPKAAATASTTTTTAASKKSSISNNAYYMESDSEEEEYTAVPPKKDDEDDYVVVSAKDVPAAAVAAAVSKPEPTKAATPVVAAKSEPVAAVPEPVVAKEAAPEVSYDAPTAIERALLGSVEVVPTADIKKKMFDLLPLTSEQSTNFATALAYSVEQDEYDYFNLQSLLSKVVGDALGRKTKMSGGDGDAVTKAKADGRDLAKEILLQSMMVFSQKYNTNVIKALAENIDDFDDYLPSSVVDAEDKASKRKAILAKYQLSYLDTSDDEDSNSVKYASDIAKAYKASGVTEVVKLATSSVAGKNKVTFITDIIVALYDADNTDFAQYLTVLRALYDAKIITVDDVTAWKESTDNLSTAKQNALIGSTAWIKEITPAVELAYNAYDDEDDDEDLDY